MANLESNLIISLVDRLTGPARGLNRAVQGLNAAAERNAQRMNALRGQMVDAVAVGYTLARSIAAPVNAAADFEAGMNRVGAALDETDAEFAALRAAALEMGRTTSFTAIESADAIEILAKNGLAASDILGGALNASLLLAASSGTDLASAGDIATDVMLQFGKGADELGGVVDGITGVLLASKFGIDDYRLALAQAGGVAGGAGVSFEDFNAAIAATSSMFASGSDAGTSFKTFLTTLIPKSAAAEAHMRELGLQFFEADGSMKSMAEIAQELQDGLAGLSEEARNEALKEIFGTDAMRTAIGLMNAGAEEIERLNAAIGDASAQEQADARMRGFAGTMRKFSSAVEGLNIAIGTALLPGLTRLAELAATVVGPLTTLAETYPEVTTAVVAASAGLVAFRVATTAAAYGGTFLQGALIGLAKPLVGAAAGLLNLLNPLRLVTNAMRVLKIAVIGTGIGAILVGIGLAGAFIYQNWEGISAAFDSFKESFSAALGPAQATIEPVIAAFEDLWSAVETVTGPLPIESWQDFGTSLGTIAGQAVSSVAGIVSEIARIGKALIVDPAATIQRMFGGLSTAVGTVDWSSLGSAIARGIIDFGIDAVAFVGSLVTSLTSGAQGSDWSPVAAAIGHGILAIGTAAVDFASGFFTQLIAAFGEIDWAELGLMIGRGILAGIQNAAAAIGAAIRNAIRGALGDTVAGFIGLGGGDEPAVDGARAAGGPVSAGRSYLVGEEGPEIFTPGASGFITPNDAYRQNGAASAMIAQSAVAGGNTVTVSAPITIYAAAGQSAREIGEEVRRALDGVFADALA